MGYGLGFPYLPWFAYTQSDLTFLKSKNHWLKLKSVTFVGGEKKKRIEAIDYKITTYLQNKNVE